MRHLFRIVILVAIIVISGCVDGELNQSNNRTLPAELKKDVSPQVSAPAPVSGCRYSDGTLCKNICCSTAATCGYSKIAWRVCDIQSGVWDKDIYSDSSCQTPCTTQVQPQKREQAENNSANDSLAGGLTQPNFTIPAKSPQLPKNESTLAVSANQPQNISQNTPSNFTTSANQPHWPPQNVSLAIYFVDVGQGDAIIIRANNATHSSTLLIDSGDSSHSSQLLGFMQQLGITQLNILMSHPDNDHMGGMYNVVNGFGVGLLISNGEQKSTSAYNILQSALKNKGVPEWKVTAGTSFELVSGVGVSVLNPPTQFFYDANENSVVVKISIGKVCAIFTGDMENEAENYVLSAGYNISCQILKVAHHGSKSSSSYVFLNAVKPEVAVISVGANNQYGHPHQEILDRIMQVGAKIYRTDTDGSITIATNGINYTITTKQPPTSQKDLLPITSPSPINTSPIVQTPIQNNTTPNPSNTTPIVQTPTQPTAAILISYVNYDAGGPYVNDNYILTEEYVVIKNGGSNSSSFGGWTLSDLANHIYYFPSDFVLPAGASVTLHTGVGANNQTDIFWNRGSAVWNNDGDTSYLKNKEGMVVSTKAW